MLALETKVRLQGDWRAGLFKVADLAEFAEGAAPTERMILDLRSRPEARALVHLPWGGFLVHPDDPSSARPQVALLDDPGIAKAGDVVEVWPDHPKLAVRYRRGGNGNVLFATERCNSYCLMCSQPPRQVDDDWRVGQLLDLVDLIDPTEPSLAISGGEPTLLGQGLVRIVERCAQVLPNTHVHILSNGRLLEDRAYAQRFADLHPSLSWGVPLYGDHYRLHDYVVQRPGAFAQTVRGLYALHEAGQRIEIRVVLVRPSVERLTAIARYIYRNLPFVEHVALMGTEPIGFAKAHRDALWVDPIYAGPALLDAATFLSRRNIAISLYNLPLCTLPEDLRPFARRSISDWKQHYLPACDACAVKDSCAGFFGWITPEWTSRSIQPVPVEPRACIRP